MQKIEDSRRHDQEKREKQSHKDDFRMSDNYRQPYYNSLVGPRARSKRSSDNGNPMDDPQSAQHLKLLQDSFPNPIEAESRADAADQPLVRVKRNL